MGVGVELDVVRLKAGLGNEMFQYALYCELKHRGRAVLADRSWYDGKKKQYSIHYTGCIDEVFTDIPIDYVEDSFFEDVKKRRDKERENIELSEYYESHPSDRWFVWENEEEVGCFSPDIFNTRDCVFVGFWQSEKYFYNCKDKVIKAFSFPYGERKLQESANHIKNEGKMIFVHYRLNQYYDSDDKYNIIKDGYYERAIQFFYNKFGTELTFVVFSDDLTMARQLFPAHNAIFHDKNIYSDYMDWYDMYLMSQCDSAIIANSTFSWWGAYLIQNSNKIIVAPEVWLVKDGNPLPCRDICPDSWIRL